MGRAALGAAAKTKTGSVRVTPAQDAYFTKAYGSLGKFLQLKVNEELNRVVQATEIQRTVSPRQEMR
jgi:hypothetical protein